MEVALSLAVWYPLMGALLFSGVLRCGKLPVLGGRPYEMRVLAKAQEIENTEEGQEVGLDVGILEVVWLGHCNIYSPSYMVRVT